MAPNHQENIAYKNTENTYLLKFISVLLSVFGFISILFLNKILNKMDEFSQFKTDILVYKEGANGQLRNIKDVQDGMLKDVDRLKTLVFVKPEEIKVKRYQ